jgi:iron complex outermembrane receptor protein
MPDKNVADSLSRLPGVTTSSASANEGGFDENDRVSMRGTNPSLTQTLINGHNVAAGDWFVLNQVQQVGRSVSYTLLPSELVDQIVVHKSSQASLVEGGVAGSVDIRTRRTARLQGRPDVQPVGRRGVCRAARRVRPAGQRSLQLQELGRHARRAAAGIPRGAAPAARRRRAARLRDGRSRERTGRCAPDLAGVSYPALVGAALFEQERKRTGGLIDVEWQATEKLNLDAQYFMSDLSADNYNRNYLVWTTHFLNHGNVTPEMAQTLQPGYVVRNNTLVQANFRTVGGDVLRRLRPDLAAG